MYWMSFGEERETEREREEEEGWRLKQGFFKVGSQTS
jgi:hypothetical protein